MLVNFYDGECEIMVETDNIAYIQKGVRVDDSLLDTFGRPTKITEVIIHFVSGESHTFLSLYAEKVWDYFTKEGKAKEV